MLTNLLQPLLLARIVSGIAMTGLAVYGASVAWTIVRHWRLSSLAEGQLALERRAELVAAVVQVTLVFALVNLALTVLAGDRLADSVAGAMCAWGVFASTSAGFGSLAVSWAVAAAAALWVVWHRVDLRMTRATLTRGKFAALLGLAPLLIADLGLATAFALELDLSVVSSCCSASLDGGGGSAFLRGAALDGPVGRGLAGATSGVAAALAAGLVAARKRPSAGLAWIAAGLSAVGLALGLPAIAGFVAPHAYGAPGHTCPFCLLHGDVGGIGWPLFGALFVASVLGASIGLVQGILPRASEPDQARSLQRRLGAGAAAGWIAAVALGGWPVLRWALSTGGAPLFGAVG